jgi:TldD protein
MAAFRELLEPALKGVEADYAEIRLEEAEASNIRYRGQEVEEASISSSLGGNVRALVKGAWGFVSFNDIPRPRELREKVALAVRQARLAGREESHLAPTPPVVEGLQQTPSANPLTIPLAQKKDLLDQYKEIILSTPGITTCIVAYGDGWKRTVFGSSQGSYVEQARSDVALRVLAVARDGGEVQHMSLSVGNRGDFPQIAHLHPQVKEISQRAVELLSAPQVKGGEYPVVLDPVMGGLFAHEAFGHLSESDFLYENPGLRGIMVLGKRFGESILNIVDDASVPGLRGSYKYDDEGVPARKNYLIREGILVGRLHSRETAARMGESPSGNARAASYRFPPIVRMSNTFIEPDTANLEDLLEGIEEGVYARDWHGGMTSMEMFTFSAGEAFMIRKGKIAELIRPVVLSGNVFTTLGLIDGIARDLDMNQGGGCGKGDQYPLPVSNGSPHIRIRKCLVGGI